MSKKVLFYGLVAAILLLVSVIWTGPVGAGPLPQFDDPVEQGEYLTTVAMCVFCHTPFKEGVLDGENLSPEAVRTAAFSLRDALDETRKFAGGHEIPLGPAGVVVTRNLTPDVETGLGAWTDEEVKDAIRTGVSRDGHHLNPVMPYLLYNNLAESDLDAIVAYLRTLPSIENEIEHEPDQHMMMAEMPPLSVREGIVAPDPSDTAARGEYLMTAVLLCDLCHTPVDEATGEPIPDLYLAGGQPFEDAWGIVYGGNITPHEETGIGTWSDSDIKRLLTEGIRPDGRRTVLVPWQYYSALTPEDVEAVVHYLRNSVAPVDHEVPEPALREGLFEYVEEPTEEVRGPKTGLLAGIVAAVVVVAALLVIRRRGSGSTS